MATASTDRWRRRSRTWRRRSPRSPAGMASSRTLTGRRIQHRVKAFLNDSATMTLFIGYQEQGRRGYAIQQGATEAPIDGQKDRVNCKVRTISGFSAQADGHEVGE